MSRWSFFLLMIMAAGLVMCCTSPPTPNYPEPAVEGLSESVGWNSAVLTAVFSNPEGISPHLNSKLSTLPLSPILPGPVDRPVRIL